MERKLYDMNRSVQAIRDLYAYANAHIGEYQKVKGYSDEWQYYNNEEETAYYDANHMLLKRVIPRNSSSDLAMRGEENAAAIMTEQGKQEIYLTFGKTMVTMYFRLK